jgi:hypothetical protein
MDIVSAMYLISILLLLIGMNNIITECRYIVENTEEVCENLLQYNNEPLFPEMNITAKPIRSGYHFE